jgi:signal peptidase II
VSLFTRNRLAGFVLAFATFGLDRAVKAWIAGPLALPEQGAIYLTSFFNLRWTQNLGVSLGLFSADSSEGKLALLAMTGLIALGVVVDAARKGAGRTLWPGFRARRGDGQHL